MAITRAQQAKQMLQDGGMLVSPSKDGRRPGYRNPNEDRAREEAAANRESRRGNIGSRTKTSPSKTTNNYNYRGPADLGVTTREKNRVTAPEAFEIIGGKKFDVTPETRGERERERVKQQIMNQTVLGGNRIDKFGNTRGSGLAGILRGFNPLSFILGLINPALGIASRFFTQQAPETLQKFKESKTLEEFRDKMRGYGRTMPTIFNNPNLDLIANKNIITPKRKPIDVVIDDDMSLIPRKNLNDYDGVTPFQKNIIENTQDQDFTNFEDALVASAQTTNPLDYRIGISDKTTKSILDSGFNLDGTEMSPEEKMEYERQKKEMGVTQVPTAFAADGGMIGGGIMDAAGRQQYFLGKLVKKATRAIKKIVKSPVGKLGLLAAGGLGLKSAGLLSKLYTGGKLTGMGKLALGAGISSLPLLFQEEEEQPTGFTGSVGGQIDPRAYTDPYGVLYGAFKAEGGSMKDEPVAKRTMPLLDMGGQEMDLRAEGGFVPIGRMEKADDVPARLSKNEFVFTADAVRNAGDGDVDKGAEVMYNMMKNLEAGGDVSEESQGLEGARNMFQTSKRLEEVI